MEKKLYGLQQELPANHRALAGAIKAVAKGRPKPLRKHLADAEEVLLELRERGFRIVPFPPLKSLKLKRRGGRKVTA